MIDDRLPLWQFLIPLNSVDKPSKNQILASSSGWVALVLNILPGLGAGYLYQRRWKAYWLTSLSSLLWVLLGSTRQLRIDPGDPASVQSDQVGLYGLIMIAFITACESAIALRNARKYVED